MSDFPADRLISLNRQAIEVIQLGIELDPGLGENPIDALREINSRLEIFSGRDTLPETLLREVELPEGYRPFAEALLATRNPAAVFEAMAIRPRANASATLPIRTIAIEPALMLVLGFVVVMILCSWSAPALMAEYAMEEAEPPMLTKLLAKAGAAMPFIATFFVVALTAAWLIWRKAVPQLAATLPGAEQHQQLLIRQVDTQMTLALIDSGVDQELASQLTETKRENAGLTNDSVNKFESVTHMAKLYGFLAQYTREATLPRFPKLLGMTLSALIVLGVSLLLFIPWTQSFYSLTDVPLEILQLSAPTKELSEVSR
ncbi:hypothetical protein [Rhodopirellula sp. MGV]|uniref:hypothetical protein n=1 Tax=Rhodopirellula sp. MGV TaxID=2023130 RepID=UPI000B95E335|nr:hypothetical protein [Rhodopirellula sp. MGV]OYP31011.1 hypothetical protein CGZ80_21790 [Rhodopirellula sp. MGV]